MDYQNRFDRSIRQYFFSVLKTNLLKPASLFFLVKTVFNQGKAARRRRGFGKRNINVPPILIFSLTNSCNLDCPGCYNRARAKTEGRELNTAEIKDILSQARDLGVSIVILAGGEPLLRKDLFEIAGSIKDMLFPVFTNGVPIDDMMAGKFKALRNIVPVISLEGGCEETDGKRGKGTYGRVMSAFSDLNRSGILFGASVTATSKNFTEVTGGPFVDTLRRSGCKLVFYIEFVPASEDGGELVLDSAQRKQLISLMPALDSKYNSVFITFPGDEEVYGGCLASGRGFVHVNSVGDLEPCPFAPYSDTNLRVTRLKEALASGLLEKIRQNHEKLKETSGGCALWNEREWVASLLK